MAMSNKKLASLISKADTSEKVDGLFWFAASDSRYRDETMSLLQNPLLPEMSKDFFLRKH